MTARVREQATMLGPRKSLVGVIAQAVDQEIHQGSADGTAPPAARPAVVILNAGIIHRVGPNRMFVGLSRMLAAAGHTVVRFDLSGIGDSEPRTDGLAPLDASLADIREVLDSLESSRQIRHMILIGLCSGANHAVIYAGQDARVVGVVLIDPSIPRTLRYYMNHYGGRMFRLRSWLNIITGRNPFWIELRRSMSRTQRDDGEYQRPDLQSLEVRTFLRNAYARTIAAGVSVLGIFTGDLESQHNYREQLLEAFPKVPFGRQLQLEYFAHTDHTFTAEADRAVLLGVIAAWVSGRATPAPVSEAAPVPAAE